MNFEMSRRSDGKEDLGKKNEQISLKIANSEDAERRLTEDEALVLQDYATQKEGIGFSEQAGDNSYAEAEKYLQELASKGLNLEGIDFEKIDLRDMGQQELLGEKLLQVASEMANNSPIEERVGFLEKINQAIQAKGIGKIISLLSLFTILSTAKAEAAGFNFKINSQAKPQTVENHQQQQRIQEQTFKFGDTEIIFEYDSRGSATGFRSRSERVFDQNMRAKVEEVVAHMLVANLDEDLARLKQENRILGQAHLIKNNLKYVCMNLLENAGVYRNLMQAGKISEARLVRETMSRTISKQEDLYKIKIFERDFIRGILDRSQN